MDSLLILARTPRPGQVKTRLLSHLTPEQACELHVAMIEDTLELAVRFPGRRRILFTEDVPPLSFPSGVPPGVEVGRQAAGDLGARISDAFQKAFAGGAQRVVVLGSDSPHLPSERWNQALHALESTDLVLGPTEDGGYYLIGARRFHPGMLHDVEWGTDRVCDQTRQAAQRAGLEVKDLELFYDLDQWSDLERLFRSRGGAPRTRQRVAHFLEIFRP